MRKILLLFFSFQALIHHFQCQRYLVLTPSVLQVGLDHIVVLDFYGENGQTANARVDVELENRTKIVSGNQVEVPKLFGGSVQVSIRILEEALRDLSPMPQYVYVRATFTSSHRQLLFNKRKRVLLSLKSLSVFVQTDKPVYTRNDDINIRIVTTNSRLVPKQLEEVVIDVLDPRNVTVDRKVIRPSNKLKITRSKIQLGHNPIVGHWTILAKYGMKNNLTSRYSFEVKDYVLPRFNVEITPPDYVNPTTADIHVTVAAKYTFGEGLFGSLLVQLGVWEGKGNNVTVFFNNTYNLGKTDRGVKTLLIPNSGYGVFPFKKKLWIRVIATERGSGVRYTQTDMTAVFTRSPYVIQFDSSKPFYKKGMQLKGSVKVTYHSGKPVKELRLNFNDQFGQRYVSDTDKNGIATFVLNTASNSKNITCQAAPVREKVVTQFVYLPFEPLCQKEGSQFSIKSRLNGPITVGITNFEIIVNRSNQKRISMTILVFSLGLIQYSTTISVHSGFNTLSLNVEPHWSKEFHVVAYHYDKLCNSISADVLTVQVEPTFTNEISVKPLDKQVSPGQRVDLEVRTNPNSDVALLAVDSGMYALNNKNKLTREQVFDQLNDFDISCEVEDFNSEGLFNAVGLSAISNLVFFTKERTNTTCTERSARTKRNIEQIKDFNLECCKEFGYSLMRNFLMRGDDGLDLNSICNNAFNALMQGERESHPLNFTCVITDICLEKFLESCSEGNAARQRSGSHGGPYLIEDDNLVTRRSYFPHVWLVDEVLDSGPNGVFRKSVYVPDSITNWILQGLSVSSGGFGVAKPNELKTYKAIFIECRMPFSVRRFEQISIVCTAYNFAGIDQLAIISFVNIPKSICTSAGIGTTLQHRTLQLKKESSTVIVLNVVPLDLGTHKLTVRLLTELGTDEAVHQMKVEPEGVRTDQFFTAELDPQDLNYARSPQCRRASSAKSTKRCFDSRTCSKPTNNGVRITKDQCCDVRQFYSTGRSWGNCDPCPPNGVYRRNNETNAKNGKAQDNYFYLDLPKDFLPYSDEAVITVTGNYLENANIKSPRAKQLRGLPRGTREQTVFALGISVANLQYMKSMGDDGSTQYRDLLATTKEVFQDVIDQQEEDGSFGKSSVYFTARAVRILTAASDFVFVDKKVLNIAKRFLSNQIENGCTSQDQTNEKDFDIASLAAHIVVSFPEKAGRKVGCPKPIQQKYVCCSIRKMIDKFKRTRTLIDDYTRSWAFHAMTFACLAQNCSVCCSNDVLEDLRVDMCTAAQTRKSIRFWSDKPDADDVATSKAITTTAIMLCSYVANGEIEEARPLARWLNSVRNTNLELPSTESTYWTQECLARFSMTLTQERRLTVHSSIINDTFTKTVKVSESNRDVLQSFTIPTQGLLKVTTTGNGVGLLQVKLSYNTIEDDDKKCDFDFQVSTSSLSNSAENEKQILTTICIRHQSDGPAQFVTVKVEIPTGYASCDETTMSSAKDKYCLDEILKQMESMESYENLGSTVFFYLSQVPSSRNLCINFKLIEKFEVQSRSPVFAKVYREDKRDAYCAESYSVDNKEETLTLFGCSKKSETFCLCAAGRCPKLGSISKRKCNACEHDYAFKVRVAKIVKKVFWYRIRCELEEILKPGAHNAKVGDRVLFWIRDVCNLTAPLAENKVYHIIGKDSSKYILDDNSLIEEWPRYYERPDPKCLRKKTEACIRKKCKNKRGSKKKKCKGQVQRVCEWAAKGNCVTGFFSYVSDMRTGHVCERNDIC